MSQREDIPDGRPSMSIGLEGGNRAGVGPGGKQTVLAIFGVSAHLEQCPPQPFYLQVPQRAKEAQVGGGASEIPPLSAHLLGGLLPGPGEGHRCQPIYKLA